MEHLHMQSIARQTMNFLRDNIRPGQSLTELRFLCEQKMLELGADSFWYYGIGAFIFSGTDTTLSISGREYHTPDRVVQENDLITVDLSPQHHQFWGDYARTIILENGSIRLMSREIQNPDWKDGILMEEKLHHHLQQIFKPEMTFDELYCEMNEFIQINGFQNLDLHGNLGHSIEKELDRRIYIEKGNLRKLSEVRFFTFEPHINRPGSAYGYKKEDIYHYEFGQLRPL